MNELALFAGAGGGILGGYMLGWKTVCAVEIEPSAIAVLIQRQNDKILPPFPIWDDIKAFDGKSWEGFVDVVLGGFPCQDISCANNNAKGIEGERSGLWEEMYRVISEVRPPFAFVENSPLLLGRGLIRILGQLTEIGYNARWCIISARDMGAIHKRERFWLLAANSNKVRWQWKPSKYRSKRYFNFLDQIKRFGYRKNGKFEWNFTGMSKHAPKPLLLRNHDGMAYQLDRIKAIGNGQVPCVAATAWKVLSEGFEIKTID